MDFMVKEERQEKEKEENLILSAPSKNIFTQNQEINKFFSHFVNPRMSNSVFPRSVSSHHSSFKNSSILSASEDSNFILFLIFFLIFF